MPDATPAAAPNTAPEAPNVTETAAPPPAAKKKGAKPVEEPRISPEADVEMRAAKLLEEINSGKFGEIDEPGDAVDEDDDGGIIATAPKEEGDEAEAEKPKKKDEPAEDDEVEEKRLAELEKAAAAEREKRKAEAALAERESRFQADVARFQQDVQQAQQQLQAAWEETQKVKADYEARLKAFDDPLELMQLIQERVPAEQLAKHLDEQLTPAKQAEWAVRKAQREARKETDPKLAAMEAQLARVTQQLEATATRERETQIKQAFASHTTTMSAEVPLAAKLLTKDPNRFYRLADEAANVLAANGKLTRDASTNFELIAKYLNEELGGYQLVEPTPPRQEAGQPENAAPVAPVSRARTLTNRAVAGRSLLPDDEQVGESVEDRAEALKRRYGKHRPA